MTQLATLASHRKDFGDFQSPEGLVVEVLDMLARTGPRPDRVFEPTCGRGHFIAGLLRRPDPPREIFGCEIQESHVEAARSLASASGSTTVEVRQADLFRLDLGRDLRWRGGGPLLVVGNLPWVTTSALGASGGSNGPERSNARRSRGIDALTGASNFDISEALWLKLIGELAPERPTIALLCKAGVARAILRAVHRDGLPVTHASLWGIDAHRWFRASVGACLLRVEVGPGPRATQAEVFDSLADIQPSSTLGLGDGRLIADVAASREVAFADGPCPLAWRQGVKHDASPVMELTATGDGLVNNRGEVVCVEAEHVYPLLKGSDLGGAPRDRPPRSVLVTQRRLGEDTRDLAARAPRLWAYLVAHSAWFERRKSSIYRGRPPFCLFGVGDYSFAPYKVAVSGLHKGPKFRLVGPVNGRPTMLDDTCYFLPCRTIGQARLLVDLLNAPAAQTLLRALTFADAKRPVTKALLQRLDLRALLAHAGLEGLWLSEWEADWSPTRRAVAAP